MAWVVGDSFVPEWHLKSSSGVHSIEPKGQVLWFPRFFALQTIHCLQPSPSTCSLFTIENPNTWDEPWKMNPKTGWNAWLGGCSASVTKNPRADERLGQHSTQCGADQSMDRYRPLNSYCNHMRSRFPQLNSFKFRWCSLISICNFCRSSFHSWGDHLKNREMQTSVQWSQYVDCATIWRGFAPGRVIEDNSCITISRLHHLWGSLNLRPATQPVAGCVRISKPLFAQESLH